MLKIKHRMLFGEETEILDGDIKYKIEKKNRVTNKLHIATKDYREDFEIDNGNCYIKDCKAERVVYDGKQKLFEILIQGELWTEVWISDFSLLSIKKKFFSDKNLLIEGDWYCHHYTVYYHGKEMFKNNKKFFSSFHEIEIYNQDYRYQALALAIVIDRISNLSENTYW